MWYWSTWLLFFYTYRIFTFVFCYCCCFGPPFWFGFACIPCLYIFETLRRCKETSASDTEAFTRLQNEGSVLLVHYSYNWEIWQWNDTSGCRTKLRTMPWLTYNKEQLTNKNICASVLLGSRHDQIWLMGAHADRSAVSPKTYWLFFSCPMFQQTLRLHRNARTNAAFSYRYSSSLGANSLLKSWLML